MELENLWSAEEIRIWSLFIGEKNKLHVLLKCEQAQRWMESLDNKELHIKTERANKNLVSPRLEN